jgi:hypothetical protein
MLFSFAEEMVMSVCPCLIGTKSLFESLDLTPKAVSKYFNKIRTRYKFVGPELDNAGITFCRRNDLHALSVSESCIRFAADKSSVTLLTDTASFLAKNQLSEEGSAVIVNCIHCPSFLV